jgi:ABC-type Fe3+ transport system permease subunit
LIADPDFLEAVVVSGKIGISTVVTSLVVVGVFAWGARESRFVRMLAGIPSGLSPLIVSLGFFLAYADFVDPFEGSRAGMVFVQSALFLPYGLRFFLPLLEDEKSGKRRDLRRVARTLGASASTAWISLEWPRWRSAGVHFGGLVFVWSFSEVAAGSFFGSERLRTLGVLLARWMGQYRFEDVNAILFGLYLFSAGMFLFLGRRK